MSTDEKHCFAIQMQTPLGARHGTLELRMSGPSVNGELRMFQKSSPVTGCLDADGHCRLYGRLSTLMNSFYYEAEGQISAGRLRLTLSAGTHVYTVTGQEDAACSAAGRYNE